jgi:septation ring formation regulator EzrA
MILILVFIVAVAICFGILIYSRVEKYQFLSQLEKKTENIPIIGEGIRRARQRLTGGAKYGYGSDYDRIKQKRAIGSIRDTGDDH